MTIHEFCKDVFENTYYMMGREIVYRMLNEIMALLSIDLTEARKEMINILVNKDLDITDIVSNKNNFINHGNSFYMDTEIADTISEWYEDNGLSAPFDSNTWTSDGSEINEVIYELLISYKLITEEEWEELNEEGFYSLITVDPPTEITSREMFFIKSFVPEYYPGNSHVMSAIEDALESMDPSFDS